MAAGAGPPSVHDGFCGFAGELRAAWDRAVASGSDESDALSPEAAFGDKLAARYRQHLETWSLLRYGLMPSRAMHVSDHAIDRHSPSALRFVHWLPPSPAAGASRDRLALTTTVEAARRCRPDDGDGPAIVGALVAVEPVLLGTLPGEALGRLRPRLIRDLALLGVEARELDGTLTMRAEIGRDGNVSRAAVLCDLVSVSEVAAAAKPPAVERALALLRRIVLPSAQGPSALIVSLRFGPARSV